MCDLLSNNSLFVGKLYEDKSLSLRARDLIFFTTDLQLVNYYSTIHDLFLKQMTIFTAKLSTGSTQEYGQIWLKIYWLRHKASAQI